MKNMVYLMCMVVATIATFQTRGGTYTWLDSPANGTWDTSSLNWSDGTTDGVAWVDDASAPNDAVFGTSSTKSVSIGSRREVNDLTICGLFVQRQRTAGRRWGDQRQGGYGRLPRRTGQRAGGRIAPFLCRQQFLANRLHLWHGKHPDQHIPGKHRPLCAKQ